MQGYKLPFMRELFYSNSYNLSANGNRLYTIEAFDFDYEIEVFVTDDGEYRIVNWRYIQVCESDVKIDQDAASMFSTAVES